MKILITLLFTSSCVFATSPKATKETPKTETKTATKPVIPGKDKEEDCDEKAKKKVEIKPESISLTGNAGCTLE